MKKSKIICCAATIASMLSLCVSPISTPISTSTETTGFVITAEAADSSRKQTAVNWIQYAADTKWCKDVDGSYGCQCVDLVMGYYSFLGCRNYAKGNGKDYATNTLPTGWKRINKPALTAIKAGDIVVWGAGAQMTKNGGKADSTYGHVGLVLKDGTSTGFKTVETRGGNGTAAAAYTRNAVPTCIIRPTYGTTCGDSLIEGATYRIRTACNSSLYVGTAGNKTAAKTNVQLVNKSDSSSQWVAHYNKKFDYWYFVCKNNSKIVLNAFSDFPVSGTNINTYSYSANDSSQGFVLVRQKDGSFKLKIAMNSAISMEVSGYAKDAKKGTNVRLYNTVNDKTQLFWFDKC